MAINKIHVTSGTGDVQAVAAADAGWTLKLCGFSVSEDAGSTAEVVIRDGTSNSDTPAVAPINCAASGFGMWGISNQGIPCPDGIYVDRVSGTTTVVLYVDKT